MKFKKAEDSSLIENIWTSLDASQLTKEHYVDRAVYYAATSQVKRLREAVKVTYDKYGDLYLDPLVRMAETDGVQMNPTQISWLVEFARPMINSKVGEGTPAAIQAYMSLLTPIIEGLLEKDGSPLPLLQVVRSFPPACWLRVPPIKVSRILMSFCVADKPVWAVIFMNKLMDQRAVLDSNMAIGVLACWYISALDPCPLERRLSPRIIDFARKEAGDLLLEPHEEEAMAPEDSITAKEHLHALELGWEPLDVNKRVKNANLFMNPRADQRFEYYC